jgi:hypothetical protein
MRTLLEWAHYYVFELGFSVIPLKFRGKTPLVPWKRYQERTPTDTELRRWFHRQDRNIGIVTGEVSKGLCVVDFDNIDLFEAWNTDRRWDRFSVVSTGRGFHVYVKCLAHTHPDTGKAYFRGEHLGDIRYNGGYVVAPPSIHVNGFSYRFLSMIQFAPVNFRELEIDTKQSEKPQRQRKPQHPKTQSVSTGIPAHVRDPWRYCQAALTQEAYKVLFSPEGERNETLFRAGLKLRKYLDVLDETVVRKRLFEVGCQVGLPEEEVIRTLDSAWKY